MECFLEIENIIWLDVFTEKLWRRHRVSTEEVEEALHSSTRIRFIEKGDVKGKTCTPLWEEPGPADI